MRGVFLACTAMLGLMMQGECLAADPVDVLYIEYAPYYYTSEGRPAGFLLEAALRILDCSGIEYKLVSAPSRRVLQQMKARQPVISIGWFKTEERDSFADFSDPFSVNKPLEALLLKRNLRGFADFDRFVDLVELTALKVGVIDGHSEGQYVDDILKRNPDNVVRVAAERANLIKMLHVGRFDYILLPPEEIPHLVASARLARKEFVTLPLKDIPSGNERRFMLSKAVPPEVLRRLNDCIARLAGTPR